MSKLAFFPSSFATAEPSYDADGAVGITLHEVVAFTVEYANDNPDDLAVASVQPVTAGWNGVEHPEQLLKLPSGLFFDRRGLIGDEAAALARFRDYRRREHRDPRRNAQRFGHRYARYRAAALLDRD